MKSVVFGRVADANLNWCVQFLWLRGCHAGSPFIGSTYALTRAGKPPEGPSVEVAEPLEPDAVFNGARSGLAVQVVQVAGSNTSARPLRCRGRSIPALLLALLRKDHQMRSLQRTTIIRLHHDALVVIQIE